MSNFETEAIHLTTKLYWETVRPKLEVKLGTEERRGRLGIQERSGIQGYPWFHPILQNLVWVYTETRFPRVKCLVPRDAAIVVLLQYACGDQFDVGECARCRDLDWGLQWTDTPKPKLTPSELGLCKSLRGATDFVGLTRPADRRHASRLTTLHILEREWGKPSPKESEQYCYRLACCQGTGRQRGTYADLFFDLSVGDGTVSPRRLHISNHLCSETEAVAHLSVLSDDLLARGEDLGQLLALVLRRDVRLEEEANKLALEVLKKTYDQAV